MAASILGRIDWSGKRDREGHRDYKLRWLVNAAYLDGPAIVFNTPGLPAIGSTWAFGSDLDVWAFCMPDWKVTPVLTREPNQYWIVEQPFSTKPLKRCQDSSIENPLNEPDRISGSFTKFTREATLDRYGDAIITSSHEQVRGSAVERDDNRPNVTIEGNIATLPLALFAPMIDTVNDAPLWGLSARMVKLSNASWSRQIYGTCNYYYTVSYEFDINYQTFDKTLLDEGTKVLVCGGDKTNPKDFALYKDINGENTRVILDGNGEAYDGLTSPGTIDVEFYNESNFLLLGIPTSL